MGRQGRKKAMKVLRTMMRERMADPGRQSEDFFDVLIEELRREKPVMTEAIALDLMFVLLFASFETTALALTLGVKLLAENPRVLRALTVSAVRACCRSSRRLASCELNAVVYFHRRTRRQATRPVACAGNN
jgi:cytochrome P450